jgi:2,3-bisphosphoglycerate-independent phosphoglycerate mutase
MKFVILIPDGAADHPISELGDKTPLEVAQTPFLDRLAQGGVVGLAANIPQGFTAGTDIGCMSIFGYNPAQYYSGRGPLEAAHLGVRLNADDIAFRCNLITATGHRIKDYSADHVSVSEATAIFETLNETFEDLPVKFYAGLGTGYRNVMVFSHPSEGILKVKLVGPHDIMGESIEKHLPSEPLLRRLMVDSRKVLEDHPVNRARALQGKGKANMIWLWGQGRNKKWPTHEERFGKKGAVITAVDLVKGIGIQAGLDIINVPGVTGYFDTNYAGKAQYALEALKTRDLVVIHVESTDEAGHMGRVDLKVKALEEIDRLVIQTLYKGLGALGDYKMLVIPDHFTCVSTRTHNPDPVPFLMYSSRSEVKGPKKYCEKTAKKSTQVVKKGHELIEIFFSL